MDSRLRAAALCGTALAVAGGTVAVLRAWARRRSAVSLPARSAAAAAAADQGKGHGKQILVLGLDGAGKTSILHSLATNHVKRSMAPTEGFNAICINTEESQMEFLEIGGSESLRSYWNMYLPKVLLLVYVVDSADHARLPVAKQLLHQLIQNNSTLPVVVLANKQCQITHLACGCTHEAGKKPSPPGWVFRPVPHVS
ncbi:ADP-ribosylation factor-like protein 9 isoform X2 [Molothrus ater]|uniref:ADP-ribosylation factor-like protein 9 isoform X2 n=1 Tax=Molothrus ater TaxID=84834 RepID=UPI00174C1DAD|nr:ADP-ribosylation factor-like protein 9 isoform X2 [Molothrus ater]